MNVWGRMVRNSACSAVPPPASRQGRVEMFHAQNLLLDEVSSSTFRGLRNAPALLCFSWRTDRPKSSTHKDRSITEMAQAGPACKHLYVREAFCVSQHVKPTNHPTQRCTMRRSARILCRKLQVRRSESRGSTMLSFHFASYITISSCFVPSNPV